MATDTDDSFVYGPRQAVIHLTAGMPLLYLSTFLDGWLEWVVGALAEYSF